MKFAPCLLSVLLALVVGPACLARPGQPGVGPVGMARPMTADELIRILKQVPPGTPVELESTSKTQTASGQGAGISTTAQDVAQQFNGSAPQTSLNGVGNAGGGDAESRVKAHGDGGTNPFRSLYFYAGLACIAVAAFKVYRRDALGAAPVAAAGGGFILAACFPELAEVLVVIAVGLKLAGYVHASESIAGTRTGEGLRAALEALSTLPAAGQQAFDAWLEKHGTPRDRDVIRAARNMDDLHARA